MQHNVGKITAVTLATEAIEVSTKNGLFLIANTGTTPIYIKESCNDKVAATADNGFLIPAGTAYPFPLCAEKLSVFGAEGSTARIMFLETSSVYS